MHELRRLPHMNPAQKRETLLRVGRRLDVRQLSVRGVDVADAIEAAWSVSIGGGATNAADLAGDGLVGGDGSCTIDVPETLLADLERFPAVEELAAGGITTWGQLVEFDGDLTSFRGIGKATAKRIQEAIDAR